MISDVPPSMELARDRRNSRWRDPAAAGRASGPAHLVAVVEHAFRPQQVDAEVVDPLVELGVGQLGGGALRPGRARAGRWLRPGGWSGAAPRPPPTAASSRSRVTASRWLSGRLLPQVDGGGDRPAAAWHDGPADGDPLVHQGDDGAPPAIADVAQTLGVGNAHVGEDTPR